MHEFMAQAIAAHIRKTEVEPLRQATDEIIRVATILLQSPLQHEDKDWSLWHEALSAYHSTKENV